MRILKNRKADEKVGLNVWVYIVAFLVGAIIIGIVIAKVIKGGLPGA